MLRLDAIAFIWKRMGTNCQNQPEVHAITQALRAVARIACPAVLFKAEAIVGPQDLVPYLGQGTHHGKVSDLAYHNGLMVQIWSMLAAQDARLAAHALQAIPPVPSTTAWITYARCHDDIGWAIDDDGRRRGRAERLRAPAVPVRLLRRATSRARGPAAWSSRRTRPPATAGSAAPRPAWPGSSSAASAADADLGSAGCSWRTRSSWAAAASR